MIHCPLVSVCITTLVKYPSMHNYICIEKRSLIDWILSIFQEDEALIINFEEKTWACDPDRTKCPGGSLDGIGCTVPDCVYSVNPFGECSCDEQFFINDDCTEGFYCNSNIPDPYLFDGCIQRCLQGQILVPNFAGDMWQCIDAPDEFKCPGKFNLNCPDQNVGGGFDDSICECDGQLWISDDCKESFYCFSRLTNGGRNYGCSGSQIVAVDFNTWTYACQEDEGQCPGLGGFQLGCAAGALPGPPLNCTFDLNPFGSCDGCEGQIYVGEDCTEAFYCSKYVENSATQEGCHLVCPEGERIDLDLTNQSWECIPATPDFTCSGSLKVDCESNFDVQCRCRNELWVNDDCTDAFWCLDTIDENGYNDGRSLSCPEGTHISLSFDPAGYRCTSDLTQCPGSFHFGCDGGNLPELPCISSRNPLGECGCEGQIFINEDCSEGFKCTTEIADPYLYDGCIKQCEENQILFPNFDSGEGWECVDRTQYKCPGSFNLNCEDEDVGNDFTSDICDCEGQMWVSNDCKEGFYCWSRLANGGSKIVCEDNTIVQSDFVNWAFRCVEDNGQCPGLGGFQLGCSSGSIRPDIECEYSENPYGTCDGCEGQIFIGDGCHGAFYCTEYIPEESPEGSNGCLKTCEADQRVHLDLDTMSWDCVTKEDTYTCPGDFSVDCNPNFDVACSCENEIWINDDCTSGFRCTGKQLDDGVNPGQRLTCPPNHQINIDFNTTNFECIPSEEAGRCPGSAHFGCDNSEFEQTNCTNAYNPFGTCGCEGQYFINDECNEGFLCTSNIDDPILFEGCLRTCPDGQKLLPDFVRGEWTCVPGESYNCPGAFNLNCPEDSIPEFDSSLCECDRQLFVSDDCKTGFFCFGSLANGGVDIKCGDGEVIDADFVNYQFACKPDEGHCPGLGGFQLGCNSNSIPPPDLGCEFTTNPFQDQCECEGQIFIGNDCTEAFYCSQYIGDNEGAEGCHRQCPSGQRIHLDLKSMEWDCVTKEQDYVCPGEFKFDCQPELSVQCGCANEIWVGPNCKSGFWCLGEQNPVTNVNPGNSLTCPDGEFLDFSLVEQTYGCTTDPHVCPGSFHFGCNGGNIPDPQTTTTTPGNPGTTTTTNGGNPGTTTTTTSGNPDTTTTVAGGTSGPTTPGGSGNNGIQLAVSGGLLAISLIISVL